MARQHLRFLRVPIRAVSSLFGCILGLIGLSLTACGDGGGGTDPVDPGGGTDPVIASVVVTSSVDTLLALGQSVQLSAQVKDTQGRTMSGVQVSWTSSDASIVSVTSAGMVSTLGSGFATISARAGTVTGNLRLRVLDTNLADIRATLQDPLFSRLITHLSDAEKFPISGDNLACAQAITAGHVGDLIQGLNAMKAKAATSAVHADKPLLGVLTLIIDHAIQQLNL